MPLHRKNDSGELDVFEAARYFSGANENNPRHENRPRPGNKSVPRLSLDMPINIALDTKKKSKEINNKKPHKQPSSPGGKLIATLINSIFNQSSKKKKKSKSSPCESRKTDQSPGRKRRSSMSHFTTSSNHDSKTKADSCAKTPTKSAYNESLLRKFPVSRPGNREMAGPHDEKNRFGNRNFGLSERNNNPKATIWDDDEDDGESDSSSDLFDLPIIRNELDYFSRGLPVYGTTHMERIRVVV